MILLCVVRTFPFYGGAAGGAAGGADVSIVSRRPEDGLTVVGRELLGGKVGGGGDILRQEAGGEVKNSHGFRGYFMWLVHDTLWDRDEFVVPDPGRCVLCAPGDLKAELGHVDGDTVEILGARASTIL